MLLKILYYSIPTIIGFLSLLIGKNTSVEKPEVTLCHAPTESDVMAQFTNLPGFLDLHPAPLPIRYEAGGEMIKFSAPDGMEAGAYLVRANSKSDKWLFVYQEWWGLNDYIKKQSDLLHAQLGGQVNILALDMYDGKVATTPQEAGQYVRGVVETRLENIIKGAAAYAGGDAQIASMGWCFGGGWSLKSALICGKQNIGSVMYYGMPVKDLEKLKTLNSDVLGLFATEEYISKTVIEEFATNMKAAGKKLDYKIFEAAHGFANPSNPRHDAAKSEEANALALRYLKEKFKI